MLDSVIRSTKYEIKKSKMENLINNDLNLSSSDGSDSESDSEFINGSDNDESCD